MNEKVAKALSYVDEKYVSAAAKRKKRKHRWVVAVAAVLALVMLFNVPSIPLVISAKAVSIASESRKMERPNIRSEKFDAWYDESQLRGSIVEEAVAPVMGFSADCSKEVLSGVDTTNRVWSPINAYIAMAITAELTGGDTQEKVLNTLGVTDLEELRTNVSALWEQVYQDNGKEISVLANSLWLDTEIDYQQEAMDNLAYHYYTSVYQGDLGSKRTNKDIANWLRNQTGGLMNKRTGNVNITPNAMLVLASTVYFQSQWSEKFDSGNNTEKLFHTNNGDVTCTYMNKKLAKMNYYWAEDFGAVQLYLENDSSMWFILPDEDKTVDDVLNSGDYMAMITGSDSFPNDHHKWMLVNLSVPKFDVSSGVDLEPALKEMGLKEIFEPYGNDFSASVDSDIPVFLDSINQDTRVTIDEDGVKAASYIILEFGAGAAEPPTEIIDFILDRPFVFAITNSSIPMFVGTVNNP